MVGRSANTWFRDGGVTASRSADCPDAIIQLICRWSCPESLHVYAQMGISKNVYWTDKAQTATFDALRVNNLPRLDSHDDMCANVEEFAASGAATVASPSIGGLLPSIGGVLVVVSSSFLGRGTPCPTVGRSAASVERVTSFSVVPLCPL